MAAIYRLEVPLQGAVATRIPGAAEIWSGLDHQSRVLTAAVVASLLLHAVLLSVHFKFPADLRWRSSEPALDVILVNARTRQRPSRSDALAQANLDGGGDTEQARRAKSPLPVIDPRTPGRDLAKAERRMRELEVEQRKLLAQSRRPAPRVPAVGERPAPADDSAPPRGGRDLEDLSLIAMRLQAEISRNLDAYQKRPRKKFIGASAVEYRFAQYEEDWRRKVERVGTVNYPSAARGKLYGNLRLTVTLRADGNVEAVELDRSSGLKVLDDAAFRIVRMASPYAAFPPQIRRDTDLLVITRTWFFGRGDRLWTE
ncbi:MAG: TonB family protein [Betaproteobacteria bacterium]|nr:TonB family protein [Betaproteobacteria bacterium]